MRPLRYSINVTLDGCVDHRVGVPSDELHEHAAATIARADALIFGRTTYELMAFWRDPSVAAETFARAIGPARKYVVSTTLDDVDWNAEIVRPADLEATVRRLKDEPGEGLYTGGVQLPLALADLGLIDEYEFVVHPRLAGHGPTLFAGLHELMDLELVGRRDFDGGVVASTYVPRR
ncbi:dihydrofolate reductase family protein [Actinomycetospora soli]|uniref:dihydrofolate reductase family protein n=1 Tax=Actinomycetospora soli TaxID=2893887 RepID=UPI001E5985D2|nr:dihydrofolate reductase family protein [Actinomycetospora soli]MCD2190720.1 dihydrofolate reductase family protein [Actinomycetospora soli]